MIKFTRICVPLSLDCNLHCRYCYRERERLDKIPEFTEDMKEYLGKVSPDWCESVVASGGEPLFHWDKVKELFSYVPKNVHKKIMSNCTLLTQEMVDYINENEIELLASHDGPQTEFLRGVDVLRNEKLCDLIRQVKILTVSCVVTKYNVDVWENYFDVVKHLKRLDFYYVINSVNDVVPEMQYLVDGFDYDKWYETKIGFLFSPFNFKHPWYKGRTLKNYTPKPGFYVGYNLLPDGTVTGMIRIKSKYGTIHDDKDTCRENSMKSGLMDRCIQTKCKYIGRCNALLQHTSEHACKCYQTEMEKGTAEYKEKMFNYVNNHLDEIVAKYFPEFAESMKK